MRRRRCSSCKRKRRSRCYKRRMMSRRRIARMVSKSMKRGVRAIAGGGRGTVTKSYSALQQLKMRISASEDAIAFS